MTMRLPSGPLVSMINAFAAGFWQLGPGPRACKEPLSPLAVHPVPPLLGPVPTSVVITKLEITVDETAEPPAAIAEMFVRVSGMMVGHEETMAGNWELDGTRFIERWWKV